MSVVEGRANPAELTPQRAIIPAQTLYRSERRPYRHEQKGGEEYALEASFLNPKEAQAAILFIHGASAPTGKKPIENYEFFQKEMAQFANSATLVYDSRTVQVERDNYDPETKSLRTPKEDEYKGTSINDRIDDAANAILWLVSQKNIPKKIVLAGVSMGGHVAIRLLDRLKEIRDNDLNEQNRNLAAIALERIGGIMLVAPAAYLENVEDLPARSPENVSESQTRTYLLRNTPADIVARESPVFATLDSDDNKHLPIFLTYGIDDTIIPKQVLYQYGIEVLTHDRTRQMRNFHLASYFGHLGLVSTVDRGKYKTEEEFKAAQQEQEILFEKIAKFVKEINSL